VVATANTWRTIPHETTPQVPERGVAPTDLSEAFAWTLGAHPPPAAQRMRRYRKQRRQGLLKEDQRHDHKALEKDGERL
jgi:hypothetical protein